MGREDKKKKDVNNVDKTQTNSIQQETPVDVTSVNGNPIDTNTSTPTAGNTANDVTIETANEPRPSTQETSEETETPDDTGGDTGGGAGGGYDKPMPEKTSENRDEVGEYKAPYTQEELDAAKKKGRRESRMATAGRVMDALARVANYAATAHGAPSARWHNNIQDVDPNTYYAKLKGANDQARKDYMDMVFKAGAADNAANAAALNRWEKGRRDAREQAAAQMAEDLHPGELEKQRLEIEAIETANEAQKINNKYLPQLLRTQVEAEKARSFNFYANGRLYKNSQSDYILPEIDEKGEPKVDDKGNIIFIEYKNAADYQRVRSYLNDYLKFDDHLHDKNLPWVNSNEIMSNMVYANNIAKAIYNKLKEKNDGKSPTPKNKSQGQETRNLLDTPWKP